MKAVSGKAFCRLLKRKGAIPQSQSGSHRTFYMPWANDIITVPVHGNKDLGKGLQSKLMKRAEIKESEL